MDILTTRQLEDEPAALERRCGTSLRHLQAKANELAAAEKAAYGMPDPHQIHQVLARYFPSATFEECYDAAMDAYMAYR